MTPNPTLTQDQYHQLYEESVTAPDQFWKRIAHQELEWFEPWTKTFTWDQTNYTYQWFVEGKLNITHNCLDRHIAAGRGDQLALIWIGETGQEKTLTYAQLLAEVNQLANVLDQLGVSKGDTVTTYLPMVIEQVVAMLACARLGAVHSVVYAGFSTEALKTRIAAAGSKVIITASHTVRRGQRIDLLNTVRSAVTSTPQAEHVLIVERDSEIELLENEHSYQQLVSAAPTEFSPAQMDSEDPLFILYTSGTTGQPKGVVHTTGGYSVYSHYTAKINFSLKPGDRYWCAADCGWITGHSYIVYGPLSNGVTSILTEGAPDYPTPDRWWALIAKHRPRVFYTAPTVIRMMMKHGAEWAEKHDLDSLEILGSVGEPINPEAWQWYHRVIGQNQAAVIDTWWQTETGGHMIATPPGLPQKPGKAGLPCLGIKAQVVDSKGHQVPTGTKGQLVITHPWPGALRDCWQDHQRYQQYWNNPDGQFATGDYARRDEDGYIQIVGRTDDIITVAGHRIGSAELEDTLVSHPAVVEAAVIGIPDQVKGSVIVAFVCLSSDSNPSEDLAAELRNHIRLNYGTHATPAAIEFVAKLPKTRSGKIVRRMLRAQLTNQKVGDVSTLET